MLCLYNCENIKYYLYHKVNIIRSTNAMQQWKENKAKGVKMKFLLAPDSFKGSLTSVEAADAMEKGIRHVFKDAEIVKLPIADGGEGTVDIFEQLGTGNVVYKDVTGPLGDRVQAKYILMGDLAVIEMAQASGLTLIQESKRNPMKTTTYGTGELILDALKKGTKKILLAVGGSATNDGGAGMAQALSIQLKDHNGKNIGFGCEGLENLDYIDIGTAHPLLRKAEITIACDVQNKLCGPEGASHIFGPQKGADEQMAFQMDMLLNHFAEKISQYNGVEVRNMNGLGAAGGIAVPLVAFFNARIVSGIDTILKLIGFESHIQNADYIFTGEGCIDAQTQYGKAISGILKQAKRNNVPVVAFCGSLGDGYEGIIAAGVNSCFCILPGVVSLSDAMQNSQAYLEDCAKRVAYLLHGQLFR